MKLFSYSYFYESTMMEDYKKNFINIFLESFNLLNSNYTETNIIEIKIQEKIKKGKLLFATIEELACNLKYNSLEKIDFYIYIILPTKDCKKVLKSINNLLKYSSKQLYLWFPSSVKGSDYQLLKKSLQRKVNFQQDVLNLVKKIYLNGLIRNYNIKHESFNECENITQILTKIISTEEEICSTKCNEYLQVLKEFLPSLWNKKNLLNQDYVWEIIINIKNNLQKDLKQAIRINLQLCYLLEEESQVKDINNLLFKINHIFDHDFYCFEQDSSVGLKKFMEVIQATYPNLDNFVQEIKIVKENLCFIRKQYDLRLIKEYKYLKNITLPVRSYEDLKLALSSILKKFKKVNMIINNPAVFKSLSEEIDNFKSCYIARYKKEHDSYQQKVREFNLNLHNLKEYKVLELLSQIKVVKVAYNLKPIKKYIDTFFPEQCQYTNLDNFLEKHTKCKCDYNLGENLTIPSLNKILPMLEKGIKEYIAQLNNNKFRKIFNNYLKIKKRSKITGLLELKSDQLKDIIAYIDQELIDEINEVLNYSFPIEVSLTEIADNLIGNYTIDQLNLLQKQLVKEIKNLVRDKIKQNEKIESKQVIINLVK